MYFAIRLAHLGHGHADAGVPFTVAHLSQVLQALHAMMEKSCCPGQPPTGGQLPFRRSFSASQAVAICWRSHMRGEMASAHSLDMTSLVQRSPIGASKRSRRLAGPEDEAAEPARPPEASVAPLTRVLPAVGTWAGRTDASAMETDPLPEGPPWESEAPLRNRRSSSVDGRIDALRSALEPPRFG